MKYDEERMKIFVDGKEVRVESLDLIVKKDSLMSPEKYEIEINGIEPIEEEKCYHHVVDGKCVKCGFTGVDQPAPWPQEGDEYWWVTSDGTIDHTAYLQAYPYSRQKSLGNCYRTRGEAMKELKRKEAIVRVNNRIKELNDGWEPDWTDYKYLPCEDFCDSDFKYYVVYNYATERFTDETTVCRPHCFILEFASSRDIVNQIISEMEGDLKLIFNIESN